MWLADGRRRYRPGRRALLEIRHLQKTTHLLIRKMPFVRVVSYHHNLEWRLWFILKYWNLSFGQTSKRCGKLQQVCNRIVALHPSWYRVYCFMLQLFQQPTASLQISSSESLIFTDLTQLNEANLLHYKLASSRWNAQLASSLCFSGCVRIASLCTLNVLTTEGF